MDKIERIKGGLYGALIGDAVGVPYEFKTSLNIPPHDQIDMIPPVGYRRTWAMIPVGTWSDDGALMLCLLETLLENWHRSDSLVAQDELGKKLIAWKDKGYMSVDNLTFDIGNQTIRAIEAIRVGRPVPSNDQTSLGNGSLMRALPVALTFHNASDHSLAVGATLQSEVTHPHPRASICCSIYTVIAYQLLQGKGKLEAIDYAIDWAKQYYEHHYETDFQEVLEAESLEPMGSGYVVDSLWSSLYAFRVGNTYEDVIRTAIKLGNDTDTTACIAGGLAGIHYGYSNIPVAWREGLRGKEILEPLWDRLQLYGTE